MSGFSSRTPIAPYNISGSTNTFQKARIEYYGHYSHYGDRGPRLSLALGPVSNPMVSVAAEVARVNNNAVQPYVNV